MAEVASLQPLATEVRIEPQVNPGWICGAQSRIGPGFFRIRRFSPVGVILPVPHAHSSITDAV